MPVILVISSFSQLQPDSDSNAAPDIRAAPMAPTAAPKPAPARPAVSLRCCLKMFKDNLGCYLFLLVVSNPLKNISQLGLLFPIYGQKIKKMFQTTNQYCDHIHDNLSSKFMTFMMISMISLYWTC